MSNTYRKAQPPRFLGARLLVPIPFVRSKTFDQRTPGVNLTADAIEDAREDFERELQDDAPPQRLGVYANIGPVSDCGGNYFGHGNVGPRTYKKKIPLWVRSESSIRELIEKAFPKFRTNEARRRDASRWAAVVHLYYRAGYTRSQIAHEIGSTVCKIGGVIRSIQRASRGLQSNGRGPRSAYGRGKHPNCRRRPKAKPVAAV